ncbi:hypothetical protein MLD38_038922 [Melastoma candidum]|uniref:Uncharacterized protein n=1 Tax=Melastoma candidum TaxID=119954 RepID=A0ACB9L0T8_9MYRT|nr:hypothetical protein MLD38_038922 [Melastoma candidum]
MATGHVFFVVIVCSSAIYVSNAARCGLGGPEVQSPFHLIDEQPCDDVLGHPGYTMKCSRENSTTVISFPSYGDLTVMSIDYETKRIDLVDPKGCVHEVFLNLDLSNTPFQHFYLLKNYTYLKCSSSSSLPVDHVLRSYDEIPCMSRADHKVYTVDVSIGVPSNCRAIKTVAIPFGYSPYISDNTFGLALTWDSPPCDGCNNSISDRHRHHQVLGWSIVLLCVCLAMAGLAAAKMYSSYVKKRGDNNRKENEQLLKHSEGMLQSLEA